MSLSSISSSYRKLTCRFNEDTFSFNDSSSKFLSLSTESKIITQLFQQISLKCARFHKFKQIIRLRNYFIMSTYLTIPVVFIFSIIGFEVGYDAFALAWFFIAFSLFYLMVVGIALYFLRVQMNEYFHVYSLFIQDILNSFNINFFIENNVYAVFRFQIYDSKGKIDVVKNPNYMKSYSLSKENPSPGLNGGGKYGVQYKLRSIFQSSLMQILRIKFWIEFLVSYEPSNSSINEDEGKKEEGKREEGRKEEERREERTREDEKKVEGRKDKETREEGRREEGRIEEQRKKEEGRREEGMREEGRRDEGWRRREEGRREEGRREEGRREEEEEKIGLKTENVELEIKSP